ncbi:YgiW/YdeI family stress tolerance OB fold protein [Orbus sturtevantii]|uniref:YgiW/YdeI family stress tolerance OB fold protein n=1 Tax=Orbus sturtevantii TaxID=3074109 RepID=UPI00370D4AEC
MKKLIPLVLIATLGISGVALAKHAQQGGFHPQNMAQQHQGGFNGGLVSATTVAQAKQLPNDSWVILKGHITKQIGKKEYLFKDDTGEVNIEIDHRRWMGQTISPDDLVEIAGEVDKDWNSFEIDVKSIKIINPVK